MASPSVLDEALRRLDGALARVEDAVEDRLEFDRKISDLESELQRLGADRSQLAQSLDAAEARSGRIEAANREVSTRLVSTMESIRDVLSRQGA